VLVFLDLTVSAIHNSKAPSCWKRGDVQLARLSARLPHELYDGGEDFYSMPWENQQLGLLACLIRPNPAHPVKSSTMPEGFQHVPDASILSWDL